MTISTKIVLAVLGANASTVVAAVELSPWGIVMREPIAELNLRVLGDSKATAPVVRGVQITSVGI